MEDSFAVELLERLQYYDSSWRIVYVWHDDAQLQNNDGACIRGNTLEAALLTALMIYTSMRAEETTE